MGRIEELTIGELAQLVGVTTRTIRYYVTEGLLPSPAGGGRYRTYGREHYVRLALIKLLQKEDMPLKKIKARLAELSLSEMQELLELGHQLKREEKKQKPITPREMLAAVLSPPIEMQRMMGPPDESVGAPLMLKKSLPERDEEEPPQSKDLWRRVTLAPWLEIHYQPSGEGDRESIVNRLVAEAIELLSRWQRQRKV